MTWIKWFKWTVIVLYSRITNKTVVDFFGGTYAVAGLMVNKIR